MQHNIIYCYDAYCNWCFGFRDVIRKIEKSYAELFQFDVLSGGMILPKAPMPIGVIAGYLLETYQVVEKATGAHFGEDYLWHIKNPKESDWFPDSLKPAIALCVFRDYLPALQLAFTNDLQHALFVEGRDLCDDEAYRHLLEKYKIPALDFYKKLHAGSYREQALQEFEMVKRLKVTDFPAVFIQTSESKYIQVVNGYARYEQVSERILEVIEKNPPGQA